MRKFVAVLSGIAALTIHLALDAPAQELVTPADRSSHARGTARVLSPALRFEPNRGQAAPPVLFQARGRGYSLALEHAQARIQVSGVQVSGDRATGSTADRTDRSGISIRFVGANLDAPLAGEDQLPGRHNYLPTGDPASWRTNIPTYGKVAYRDLYSGVDLSFYGNPDRLEYDFYIAAGSDPAQIRLALDGAERVTTDRSGNLVLELKGKTVRFLKPVAYQAQPDGSRRQVDVAYRMVSPRPGRHNAQTLSFALGSYDHALPLVIDPVVDYSFYLPANVSGYLYAGASTTDSAGNTYIAGAFPYVGREYGYYQYGFFIAKYNSSGQQIYESPISLSSSFTGYINAIAVDASGKVYITGSASGLATTSNAYQTSAGGAFVSVLSADGSSLLYSSYFGGNTIGRGVAADANGNVYIAGTISYGNGTSLPVTSGAPVSTIPGQFGSGFLAKLNPNASGAASLVYCTYIGAPGTYIDSVQALAIDSSGDAYVTGNEEGALYQVTPGAYAYDGRDPQNDVFVSKLNAAGTAFVYSSLLGPGIAYGIALDSSNDAYVTGQVYEDDYPTTSGAYQTTYSSGFITELNPGGSSLIYSTFLGGSSDPFTSGAQLVPSHIALPPGCASSCEAFVAGYTNVTDLPLVSQVQSYIPWTTNSAFYVELAGNGASALQSSYFASGAGFDPYDFVPGYGIYSAINPAIGVDSASNIYLVGDVLNSDLPVTETVSTTTGEGFLAKIAPSAGATLAASPASVNFGSQIVGVGTAKQGIAQPTVLLENLGSQAATLSSITVSPSNVFAQTNNCNGTVPAGGNCTLTLNFTPGAVSTNPQNGTITVASNATVNPTIQLTGTAIDDRYIVATCGGVTPCPGLTFADTAVGSGSAAQIVTLTNLGDTAVTLSSLTTSVADYSILTNCPVSGATLAHNATCEVSVQFSPSQTGVRTSTISAASTGTTADAVAIVATGTGLLSPNASSLVLMQSIQNFGSEVVGGTSATVSVTVFNNGSSPATVFLPTASTSGDASDVNDYSIVSNTCTMQLLPEAMCNIGVAFVPTAAGTRSGTLTVPNSTTTTLTSNLTGIGLAAQQTLLFSPSSITFPDQIDNIESSTVPVTVYNTGASPVSIDRVVISGASFLLTADTCSETTLAPSPLPSQAKSCIVSVAFDPLATGAQTGSLTVIDTEGNQSAFSLAGNGVAQSSSLLLNPDELDFGYEPVGSTSAAELVGYSSVGNVPVTITSVATTGDFVVSNVPTLPFIASSGVGSFYLAFAPTQVANPDQGTLTVTTTAGTRTVSLTGIGVQATKSLVLTPSSGGVNFGTVEVGSSATADSQSPYLVNVYNNGSDPVTLSSAAAISGTNAADFTIIYPSNCGSGSPAGGSNVVSSGAYCTIYFNFKPSASGTRTATLTVTDDASTGSGVQTIALSGMGSTTAPGYQLEPLTLDVAPQAITTNSSASFLTFTNSSDTALTISSVTLAPSNGFVVRAQSPYCAGTTLKANGGSCYIVVNFAPDTAGMKSATVTFTDSNNNTYVANLNGYGVPTSDNIAVSPGDGLNFEPQPLLSTSAGQEITLTNSSGAPVTFGAATTTNANLPGGSAPAAFTVTQDTCSGFTTTSGSESCLFIVGLSPTSGTALGAQSGKISIPVTYGDGTASTVSMALNGTVVPDIDSAELSTPVFTFPDEAINATPSANAGDQYQHFTITNKSNLPITIGQATSVNTFNYAAGRGSSTSSFGYNTDGCSNQTLPVGGSCLVYIAFLPLTAGPNITGSMAFPVTYVDKTTTLTASYSGNALPANNSLLITPNSANFGEVVVGQSGTSIVFNVTNNGNQPVTFGTYTLTSTQSGTNFVRSNFDYNSCSGVTLAAGAASCSFTIGFQPQTTGTINGVLTIADGSATGGPHTIPLVGTGVAAASPVTASQTAVTFGNTPVGSASPAQVVYITNDSTSNVTGATYTLGGTNSTDFTLTSNCGSTLTTRAANAASCGLQVVFSPATASLGARTATVTVAYTGGGPLVITLNGTGVTPAPAVTLFPASLVFTTQDIGTTSAAQSISVTNTGSASLKITSAASTNSAEYAISSNGCNGTTLAAGADCLIGITFTPTASGSHGGTISVTDNAANSPQTASLSALLPKAALNVSSLTFNSQNDGTTSAAQTATLSNTGTGPLYIASVALAGADASDFTQTNTCGTNLAAGAACTISVKFAPSAAGSLTASVIVTDNTGLSAGSTQSVALTGTGVPVAATPTFTPVAGTYTSTQSVTIADTTTEATIYYTTNGSTPTTSSTPYSTAISVSSSETINAIAVATGYANSSVGSAAYVIQPSVTASVSPTSIAFANTKVGSTSAYIEATLTNNGSATMSAVALSITGPNASSFFLPSSHQGCAATLAAGASCTFYAAFEPTVAGALTASVQITDSASNSPQIVALSGTGVAAGASASVSPTSIAFANTKVGSTSAYIEATLTNNGSVALSAVALSITGTNASSFFLPSSHQGCTATLAAGARCTFYAAFEPTTSGALTASVQITDSATNSPQTVALSGTGAAAISASVSPTSVAFATTTVGSTSSYIPVTLTNNGTSTLTGVAFSITGANASSFSIPSSHQTCAATLAAGASCTFDVAFTPTATGALSGSVQIADSATNSPQTVSLTGTGR